MNRNTFVFGIGGTGARVVRALTMLLAAGTEVNETNKIIPVIIDVDALNADTSRALQALEKYKYIRERGYGNAADIRKGFFHTDLNTLSSIGTAKNSSEKVEDSFQLQFENLEKSFIDYLDPDDELVGDVNMDFLEALYDNTPPEHPAFSHSELHLRLDQGFKGNPNIGSVVFNNLANTKEFKFVLKSIGEKDRIFIISSIFGGTGSSGFPQLVRLLQEEERLQANIFGALTVMPYFNVTDDGESAINSDRFNSKTEAALSYYHKYLNRRINCFYQLWDAPIKQYENKQGGVEQKNNAHLVELIGATAVIDFVNKEDGSFKAKTETEYFDFGIKQADNIVDIRHFFDHTAKIIMEPLTLLAYAMKIHTEIIPKQRDEAFYKELNLEDKWSTDPFYQNLFDFLGTHFKGWLEEMVSNGRTFQPFNLDQDLNGMVREKPVGVKLFMGIVTDAGISEPFLKKELGKIEDELKKTIPDPEKRYFKLLNVIAAKCFEKLNSLPTMI